MKKYQVIGGQYEFYWYGESDTLLGAKRIAGKHDEYWNGGEEYHRPRIYSVEDCTEMRGGNLMFRMPSAKPICVYDSEIGKWIDIDF